MNIYTLPVSGASPGINGIIVIVAKTRSAAISEANNEVVRINKRRADETQQPVKIDPEECQFAGPFGGDGVVYSYDSYDSYDGEA